MRKLLCLLLVLATAGTVSAEYAKMGTAGAQFLQIGVGSKYQGMGGSSVATVNDAYAMFWNPAGLVEIENWDVSLTNVNWLLDIDLNYVAIARRFEDVGVFGISATVLSVGEQEITTVAQQDGTGENYSATSYAIGLSFARRLTNRFSFGTSVKYIGEEIGQVNARGMAFDFGTMFQTGFNSLRIGMAITNMGGDMRFSGNGLRIAYDELNGEDQNAPVSAELWTNSYNLPLTFRLGMAYDMPMNANSVVTFAGQFDHPSDAEQRGALGTQVAFSQKFFLRGGYKINYDEESLAFGGGLVTGIGGDARVLIDYAWQNFGRLESTHRFSVGFTF